MFILISAYSFCFSEKNNEVFASTTRGDERPATGQSVCLPAAAHSQGPVCGSRSFHTCCDVPQGKTENTVKNPSALIDRLINWISGFGEAAVYVRAMRKAVSWESDEGVEIFTAVRVARSSGPDHGGFEPLSRLHCISFTSCTSSMNPGYTVSTIYLALSINSHPA